MVPKAGLELARSEELWILSPELMLNKKNPLKNYQWNQYIYLDVKSNLRVKWS